MLVILVKVSQENRPHTSPRVAIARAILKNAPILLLDEATSALDSETEYQVKEELDQIMKNRTTLVIAHRLTTIQNADLIVVINNGELEQIGSRDELLSKDGLYRKLHMSCFEKEEFPALAVL
jgi:ATP-binding cassette, subfamily B, bacterial